MRTIKFRGQRIDNGEWVYGFLYELPLESGNVCMILTTDNIHKDNSIEPQYHLAFTLWKDLFVVDSSTVGQFTGLYDKNSKEIYEGNPDKTANELHESFVPADEEEQPKKKHPKILSMFYALPMCLFYVALAIGINILLHKLFGWYCGIDSITFSMVFSIIWVLCYLSIKED